MIFNSNSNETDRNGSGSKFFEFTKLIIFDNRTLNNASALPPDFDSYDQLANDSLPATSTVEPHFFKYLEALHNDKISLLALLFLFSVATVFGNSLVILSVIRERSLHTQTNYFITSLAVADCFVGLIIMPFSALYEVFQNTWFFGEDWCDIWRSLDVLFSTASILNLCVISLDRYWAITDPFSYPMRMTRARSAFLIACVWVSSSAISFPAISFWRASRKGEMPAYKCTFTEDLGYLVFSSTISFYLPLLVMVFTYCRIYRAAVIQTRSLKMGTKQVLMASGELQLTLRIHRGGTVKEPRAEHIQQAVSQDTSTPEDPGDEDQPLSALQNNGLQRHRQLGKNFSLSRKLAKFAKEKKAAKTLGCVMGCFVICWLPFFIFNLLSGFCIQCIPHEEVISAVVNWLGWINSSMNPVIYACWSRDFRRAFIRLLCICCPRKVRRKYQPTMRSKASQRHPAARGLAGNSSNAACRGCHRTIRLRSKKSFDYYQSRPGHQKVARRCTFEDEQMPGTSAAEGEAMTSGGGAAKGGGGGILKHSSCHRESSNSSNTSSIRIIEFIC